MSQKITKFVKGEAVLVISLLLAVGSMFFVPPSAQYVKYIDFRTLALLACLMSVTAGLSALGIFTRAGQGLVSRAKSTRSVVFILVLLCFFSSMLITNDVALITFVPFAAVLLNICGIGDKLVYVAVLQTVAANLGSMLTPIGNPQNLYLYAAAGMSAGELVVLMLPYTALALLLLVVCCLFVKKEPLSLGNLLGVNAGEGEKESASAVQSTSTAPISRPKLLLYSLLFALCLLTVFRIIPYYITFAIHLAALLLFDRAIIRKIDISLLATFAALFIFIGNLGNIGYISELLGSVVWGNEVAVGIAASQLFSNVPAAILLSGFTDNLRGLIIGVNLGGLGTLIASMASLITYRLYSKEGGKSGRFIALFTIINLVFLAFEINLHLIIG